MRETPCGAAPARAKGARAARRCQTCRFRKLLHLHTCKRTCVRARFRETLRISPPSSAVAEVAHLRKSHAWCRLKRAARACRRARGVRRAVLGACEHASMRACIDACMRRCAPACLPAGRPACLHARWPVCLPSGRPACVRASVRPCVRAYVRTSVRTSVRPCVRASVLTLSGSLPS